MIKLIPDYNLLSESWSFNKLVKKKSEHMIWQMVAKQRERKKIPMVQPFVNILTYVLSVILGMFSSLVSTVSINILDKKFFLTFFHLILK